VHCDLEVWLVVFVEESFEKCMLVRVEEVLCNRGITNENAARFSVGSRFYLRQQEPKNSMRVLKLTTHTKYGTEPVQAPNNDFPCVLLMSRCFSIDQKFGYQQLVLNMWRFAEVYKRTLSTSRLSDVFTQFSREQLCLETRRAQLTESTRKKKKFLLKTPFQFVLVLGVVARLIAMITIFEMKTIEPSCFAAIALDWSDIGMLWRRLKFPLISNTT
jgi:hypothetical protein